MRRRSDSQPRRLRSPRVESQPRSKLSRLSVSPAQLNRTRTGPHHPPSARKSIQFKTSRKSKIKSLGPLAPFQKHPSFSPTSLDRRTLPDGFPIPNGNGISTKSELELFDEISETDVLSRYLVHDSDLVIESINEPDESVVTNGNSSPQIKVVQVATVTTPSPPPSVSASSGYLPDSPASSVAGHPANEDGEVEGESAEDETSFKFRIMRKSRVS